MWVDPAEQACRARVRADRNAPDCHPATDLDRTTAVGAQLVEEGMMAVRVAEAEWRGQLTKGEGNMKLGSGAFTGRYSCGSRFEDEQGPIPRS
jgi:hypothetical protein